MHCFDFLQADVVVPAQYINIGGYTHDTHEPDNVNLGTGYHAYSGIDLMHSIYGQIFRCAPRNLTAETRYIHHTDVHTCHVCIAYNIIV